MRNAKNVIECDLMPLQVAIFSGVECACVFVVAARRLVGIALPIPLNHCSAGKCEFPNNAPKGPRQGRERARAEHNLYILIPTKNDPALASSRTIELLLNTLTFGLS